MIEIIDLDDDDEETVDNNSSEKDAPPEKNNAQFYNPDISEEEEESQSNTEKANDKPSQNDTNNLPNETADIQNQIEFDSDSEEEFDNSIDENFDEIEILGMFDPEGQVADKDKVGQTPFIILDSCSGTMTGRKSRIPPLIFNSTGTNGQIRSDSLATINLKR